MTTTGVFELLAALAALVAALFIFDQHLHRPRPYKLMWSLGLLFYGIAAFAAFLGSDGWTAAEYKAWYFFGGILTAAYLGLGTLYLLAPRRVAHVAAGIAVALSLYASVRTLTFAVPASVAAQLASAPFAQVTNVSGFHVLPGDLTVLERLAVLAPPRAGLPRRLDGAAGAGLGGAKHHDGPAAARLQRRRRARRASRCALPACRLVDQPGRLHRLPRPLHQHRAARAPARPGRAEGIAPPCTGYGHGPTASDPITNAAKGSWNFQFKPPLVALTDVTMKLLLAK